MSHSRTPVENNLSLFCVLETGGHDSDSMWIQPLTNLCGLWMFVTVSILSLRDSVSGSDVHTELTGGDSLLLPAEVLKALDKAARPKASSSLGEGVLRANPTGRSSLKRLEMPPGLGRPPRRSRRERLFWQSLDGRMDTVSENRIIM